MQQGCLLPCEAACALPAPLPGHLNDPIMPLLSPHWSDRLRTSLPTPEGLAAHPWLKPWAGRILDRRLWRLQGEPVARGVAVGAFWAFAVPVAQILIAAVHCAWWRANIPVAAAVTMVTNPLTIGFWLWLAYGVGAWVLGVPPDAAVEDGTDLLQRLSEFGGPIVLGMAMFAVGSAGAGYLGVKLLWRWRMWCRVRVRRQRSAARGTR